MLIDPHALQQTLQRHKVSLIWLTGLAIVGLLLRLLNLSNWPIFADEAIYIRWSQVMKSEPTLRFLPLTDGKQPLFMWLTIPFLKIYSSPLIAGRTVSILAGLVSLVGMYALAWRLTLNQNIARIAAALYSVVPYAVFFDRYALADSVLNTCFIWSIYFTLTNLKNPQLVYLLLGGIVWGSAAITKSPALMLGVIIPSTLLLLPKKSRTKLIIANNLIAYALMAVLAGVIYNLLRLGPEFHQIALRNRDYVYPLREIIANPLFPFVPNIKNITSFYWYLLTPGVFTLAVGASIVVWRKHQHQRILVWLAIWVCVPVISQAFLARNITARYLLYTLPSILLAAAITLEQFINHSTQTKWFRPSLLSVILLPIGYQIICLLFAPQYMLLPRIERSGYLEEWTAGTGLTEIAQYVEANARDSQVVVGTEGFFGTTPDGLQIYFDKHPNVKILGNSHILDQVPQSLRDAAHEGKKTFLVINDERLKISEPQSVGLTLLKNFPKAIRPDGTHQTLLLYQVNNKSIE